MWKQLLRVKTWLRRNKLTKKARKVNWGILTFLLVVHLVGLIAGTLYIYHYGLHTLTAVLAVGMYFVTGLSITAGYHRYFSHGAFRAHPVIEFLFVIFGAGAFEGHVEEWCLKHRCHHRFTDDRVRDPYSFTWGFWYSHILWMLRKRSGGRFEDIGVSVGDLKARPAVRWQKRNIWWLSLVVSFGLPTAVASLWGDWLGGLLIAGVLRQLFIYHSTWSVNSFAHWIGSEPFPTNISPRNSWWVALLTLGEGYHANHHQFDSDYRNAFEWYQYDPTKWILNLLIWLGLVWDPNITPQEQIEKAKGSAH